MKFNQDIVAGLKDGWVYEESDGGLVFCINGHLYIADSDGKLHSMPSFGMLAPLVVKDAEVSDVIDMLRMHKDTIIKNEGEQQYRNWKVLQNY
jgi:hypothetical protein